MAPPPRAFMSGWHSCMSRNVASAPDSHAVYMSSSVHSSSGPVGTCCALFTSTSMPPNRSTAAATIASQSDRSRTLPARAIARSPSASISSTVRDPVSGSRSRMAMRAPCLASARAIPRPIPRPPPVTMATLSSSARSPIGMSGRDRHRFLAGQPVAPGRAQVVPLVERLLVGLPELLRRRTNLVGDRLERIDVEAVELGRVQPEDALGLVDRDVPERLAQDLLRVRPGALGVREVVPPHDVADTDLVAPRQLPPPGVRRAEPAVAVEVLA